VYTRSTGSQTRSKTKVDLISQLVSTLADGDRPEASNVENRLRNLEHLIFSIPGGSAAASSSLSSDELDRIRIAAHTTSESDSSPPSKWTNGLGGGFGYDQPMSIPWSIPTGYTETMWTAGTATEPIPNPLVSPPPPPIVRSPSTSGQDLLYK